MRFAVSMKAVYRAPFAMRVQATLWAILATSSLTAQVRRGVAPNYWLTDTKRGGAWGFIRYGKARAATNVAPVYWSDNDFSLLPGESRNVTGAGHPRCSVCTCDKHIPWPRLHRLQSSSGCARYDYQINREEFYADQHEARILQSIHIISDLADGCPGSVCAASSHWRSTRQPGGRRAAQQPHPQRNLLFFRDRFQRWLPAHRSRSGHGPIRKTRYPDHGCAEALARA